jgi:hypothetical protein
MLIYLQGYIISFVDYHLYCAEVDDICSVFGQFYCY